MRYLAATMAALTMATLLIAGAADARDLTVVGFGGGFQDNARKDLFQAYAKETGQPVRDDVYNGEMAKVYAMSKAGSVDWDVVMVEAPELARGCEDGVFDRLDWSVIDRAKFVQGGTSTCGAGAVGWGVTLFYDQSKIPSGPKDYAQLWDTKTFPGKRMLRYGAKMTLEIALMADGVAAQDVYKVLGTREGQDRAFAKLDTIKPDLMFWRSGTQPLQLVGSGDVTYAVGYVGRTYNATKEGRPYPLMWNTLLYSFDSWAVVKGTPREADAMKLISYMTDAKPLLALSRDWPISPATASVADNASVHERNPGMVSSHTREGLFIDTDFWVEHGEDLEKRFVAWSAK